MELQLLGTSKDDLDYKRSSIQKAIPRLEQVFSVFDPQSELSRFSRTNGELVRLSSELGTVLKYAHEWNRASKGAFHPCAGVLADVWRAGLDVNETVQKLKVEPYGWASFSFTKNIDLQINLNAVAKGFIIDELAGIGFDDRETGEVMVNIGGDIRHKGDGGIIVDILDPQSEATNADVISRIKVCNAGFATSGNAMRPVQTPHGPVSHIFDPRTGLPVDFWAGVSVLAPSAMEADLLATTLMVLNADEAVAMVEELDGVEFLGVKNHHAGIVTSTGWQELMG